MDNRVALVTGGAGGIGAAVAAALGERGVCVAVVDRDKETLDTAVEKLTANGVRAAAFATDVTDSGQVEATVDAVEQQLGPIDYLVNAAGILRLGEARQLSDDDFAATFAVNLIGVCNVSRAVVNRMVARSRGAIVTVSSNAADTPRVQMAAYAASKAGATMFTKCLGLEVAKHGIRCNVVAPGSTDTPMLRSMWHDDSGPRSTLEGRLDAYRVGIPLAKLASPSDVANAVVFLLSDEAGHITMQSLTVDGGAGLGV
jgi:2,3-dihydro-2,3-dihydroxybenzoate dehydrogenase